MGYLIIKGQPLKTLDFQSIFLKEKLIHHIIQI